MSDKDLERNQRVFQAWAERKAAEQKKRKLEALRAEKYEEEILQRRLMAGAQAYKRWQERRRVQEEQIQKQKMCERELMRLERVEKEKRKQQASLAFDLWLQKKDAESESRAKHSRQSHCRAPKRAPTPPLPGYCSVWSCDSELADTMLQRVPRGQSHSLTETLNYTLCHSESNYS